MCHIGMPSCRALRSADCIIRPGSAGDGAASGVGGLPGNIDPGPGRGRAPRARAGAQ